MRRATAALAASTLAVAGIAALSLSASDPASAAPGDVAVSANFDDGQIPAGWNSDGAWTVKDGRLVGTSASGNKRITFGRHLNDFRFEATARFDKVNEATRWTAFGLDVPAGGAVPWWIATMRSGTTASNGLEFAELNKSSAWNVTNTTSAPTAAGTGRDVEVAIEVHGNQARWFFDGTQMMRTTSLVRSADGGQALVVNGATVSFDDVKVTELPANGYLRPAGTPMTVIAHRGASSAAPENTLAAQEVARKGGADFIENDVQPSKDGVPFILHDPTVDRTTDGTGAIRSLTSAELKALDAGSWFSPNFAGERLPTLAEQLADLKARGGNLLLEIKGAHTRDEVATIVKVIRDAGMTQRVFIQSFEVDALKYSRELAPELPTGLLRSGLDADPVAVAKDLGVTAYNPTGDALIADPKAIADLHAAGIAVMAWTVDSAAQWKKLDEAGVDGVITNRPAELVGWSAARQQTAPQTPAPASVTIASPVAAAVLDRSQKPVVGVVAANAEDVKVTVDGAVVEAGTALDLSLLAAGEHKVEAEATGEEGVVKASSTFTVAVTRAGLLQLVLNSGADAKAVDWMLGKLVDGKYADVAKYAQKESGKRVPAGHAAVIAADAAALAAAEPGRPDHGEGDDKDKDEHGRPHR
ncbi:glycerophosphoryl diester phosphodiesterase [Actinocorallia herbida]|uniref:Glycerophosphoryl diester phosphodiesterase n=1 Tax=Actinocorallia herbida TaxID=58109 RepID=A0A3N1CR38_9ACTN|nr:glycerophosphoryl diester phosphodiesterase [Actinocorallia herbida]